MPGIFTLPQQRTDWCPEAWPLRTVTATNDGPWVLIIEDDLLIRECMAEVLELEGYGVRTADSGQEALTLLEDARAVPGLILLDLMLPGMSGAEFRSRQLAEPRWASIPTLIVSGDPDAERSARELGAAGFLAKPLEMENLILTIRRHCGRELN